MKSSEESVNILKSAANFLIGNKLNDAKALKQCNMQLFELGFITEWLSAQKCLIAVNPSASEQNAIWVQGLNVNMI